MSIDSDPKYANFEWPTRWNNIEGPVSFATWINNRIVFSNCMGTIFIKNEEDAKAVISQLRVSIDELEDFINGLV